LSTVADALRAAGQQVSGHQPNGESTSSPTLW
jgi:hypothetical protein